MKYNHVDPRYKSKSPRPSRIPYGLSSIDVGNEGRNIRCLIYKPDSYSSGTSGILLNFHGTGRAEVGMVNSNRTFAQQHGLLSVAPKWSADRFPYTEYHRLGITPDDTASGPIQLLPKTEWLTQDIHYILSEIYIRDGIDSPEQVPLYFFGHSAGGQVLHRLRLLWPDCKARLVAGNPGFVTAATDEFYYPWGINGLDPEYFGFEQIRRWLEGETVIFNGNLDDAEDWTTPATARQGVSRYDRVKYAMESAAVYCFEHGFKLGWKEVVADGAAHFSTDLLRSKASQEAFFGEVGSHEVISYSGRVDYHGAGDFASAEGGELVVPLPYGASAGMMAVLFVSSEGEVGAPAGWERHVANHQSGARIMAFSKILTAGDFPSVRIVHDGLGVVSGQVQCYSRKGDHPTVRSISASGHPLLSGSSSVPYEIPVSDDYGQHLAMAALVTGPGSPTISMHFTAGGYGGSGETAPAGRMMCGTLITYKGQKCNSHWNVQGAGPGSSVSLITLLIG